MILHQISQAANTIQNRKPQRTRIFVEDSFDAAHWLPRVPAAHKCHNLHGHTYHVRIEVEGEIDEATGWVVDYAVIKAGWEAIKGIVDHHNLNEIEGLENSTCELLAAWIWRRLQLFVWGNKLARLEVRETERCGVVLE